MGDAKTVKVLHPNYVMFSSDFSQQEPKLTAFCASDPNMIKAFQEDKDIYAFIASIAFHKPYEECLEFHPVTHEYQPEGKKRRTESKSVVLGICYGRSVAAIGQQLYSSNDAMSDDDKTKEAQFVYDSVLKAFPNLKHLMVQAQAFAHKHGYVETILGRRRHLPDMMLDDFDFEPMPDYVNPDIDPLDPSSLGGEAGIPKKRIDELKREFAGFKYFGQIARRTKELYEKEHIRVRNNRPKITDARRQCVNCVSLDTEILTDAGWKTYDQVKKGDKVVAFDIDGNVLVWDEVKDVIVNDGDAEAIHLSTKNFDAVCTPDHRWVMRNFVTKSTKVYTAENIMNVKRPRYQLQRIAPPNLSSSDTKASDSEVSEYACRLDSGDLGEAEALNLSEGTCQAMLSWYRENRSEYGMVSFDDEAKASVFQCVGIGAGKILNITKERYVRARKDIDTYVYKVSCPVKKRYECAQVPSMRKERITAHGTWCVSTGTTTWMARRNGMPYITGNSIIQGSAADFTKMALLKVTQDPRWDKCGAQILTVVHDEIIAQAPEECWREAAAVLKEDMEQSGEFLPFPIKCDVESTYRWYGLGVDHSYEEPTSVTTEEPEQVKWLQYHLIECEYELPSFKDSDGNDPIGDAAHGINGIRSDEMERAISDYMSKYRVDADSFIDDIRKRVRFGLVMQEN